LDLAKPSNILKFIFRHKEYEGLRYNAEQAEKAHAADIIHDQPGVIRKFFSERLALSEGTDEAETENEEPEQTEEQPVQAEAPEQLEGTRRQIFIRGMAEGAPSQGAQAQAAQDRETKTSGNKGQEQGQEH
jgi:hypothetical protein